MLNPPPTSVHLLHHRMPLLPEFQRFSTIVKEASRTRLLLVYVWIALNVADIVWIYFYIDATINRVPRNAINVTRPGQLGFAAMMYTYSNCLAILNLVVFWVYYSSTMALQTLGEQIAQLKAGRLPKRTTSNSIFMVPVAVIMILAPIISPPLGQSLAQQHAWAHDCDHYPVSLSLNGGFILNMPIWKGNQAQYFINGAIAYTFGGIDYTYNDTDIWSFQYFVTNKSPIVPTILSVDYDLVRNNFSAYCNPTPSWNTSSPCAIGSFDIDDHFTFNITDLRDGNSTKVLRAVDQLWDYHGQAPSVLLKDQNGLEILRTSVTKKSDCRKLKVCAATTDGLDVTVPIGLMLKAQADYADPYFGCHPQ